MRKVQLKPPVITVKAYQVLCVTAKTWSTDGVKDGEKKFYLHPEEREKVENFLAPFAEHRRLHLGNTTSPYVTQVSVVKMLNSPKPYIGFDELHQLFARGVEVIKRELAELKKENR